jgi:SAM-dependent methyltransferase
LRAGELSALTIATMTDRPPQWTEEHARHFQEEAVVELYHLRMPYPPGVFDLLVDLLPTGVSHAVLDVGTGDGTIARALIDRVDRVDAVDFSPAMLAVARRAPNGEHPRLRWIEGRAEDVELRPPYGLVVCGDSLAWMDWEIVLPRFARALAPGGKLALVARWEEQPPWREPLQALIERYSVFGEYREADLVALLAGRGLFREEGRRAFGPEAGRQRVDDYVLSWHSRAGLARHRMSADDFDAFGAKLRAVVQPRALDGWLELGTTGRVVWGEALG